MNCFGDSPYEQKVVLRVIHELVYFYQELREPKGLSRLINTLPGGIGVNFFKQVSKDLYTDKYDGISASEFRQLLEDEYCREYEKHKRKIKTVSANFGKQIVSVASHIEPVEQEWEYIEPVSYAESPYAYTNYCWNCKEPISSAINVRCPTCRLYICSCGACFCNR